MKFTSAAVPSNNPEEDKKDVLVLDTAGVHSPGKSLFFFVTRFVEPLVDPYVVLYSLRPTFDYRQEVDRDVHSRLGIPFDRLHHCGGQRSHLARYQLLSFEALTSSSESSPSSLLLFVCLFVVPIA